MDRLSSQLDRSEESASGADGSVIGFGAGDEHLVAASRHHLAINRELFDLAELDCLYQAETAALWTFMRPSGCVFGAGRASG